MRALMIGDSKTALEAARVAWGLAEQQAREDSPVERDFVRAGWLIGAALTAQALDEDAHLAEAEPHLTEASHAAAAST